MFNRLAVAVLLSAVIASCAWAQSEKSANVARDKALQSLLDRVQTLKMSDKQTVGDYLKNTSLKPEQYKAALLKGAEELPPTAYTEDGRAQLTVQLAPAALVENLKVVAKGQGATGAAFDISGLEAQAGALELKVSATGEPTQIQNVPGWAGVNLRKRLEVDAAAHADAVNRLVALSENMTVGKATLKSLMDSNTAVHDAVLKFFSKARPASKTRYSEGIVAVKVEVSGAALWNALGAALKPAKPEDAAAVDMKALGDAAVRDADKKLIATGYARLDGKAFEAAQLTAEPRKIEISAEISSASALEGK